MLAGNLSVPGTVYRYSGGGMVIGQRNAPRTGASAHIHDRARKYIDEDGSQQRRGKHPYRSGFETGNRSRAPLEYSMSHILAKLYGQVRAFTGCVSIHDEPPRRAARYLGTNVRWALMTVENRRYHNFAPSIRLFGSQ
jgi:hypothetical protein